MKGHKKGRTTKTAWNFQGREGDSLRDDLHQIRGYKYELKALRQTMFRPASSTLMIRFHLVCGWLL